ncbi:hypothetical protein ACIBO2_08985 [Nonomuraea sp. NPDC050022]
MVDRPVQLRRELTAFGRKRLGTVAPKEIAFERKLAAPARPDLH